MKQERLIKICAFAVIFISFLCYCQTGAPRLILMVIPHSELLSFVTRIVFSHLFLFIFPSSAHPLCLLARVLLDSPGSLWMSLILFVFHNRRPSYSPSHPPSSLPSSLLPPAISRSIDLPIHLSVWPIFSGVFFLRLSLQTKSCCVSLRDDGLV